VTRIYLCDDERDYRTLVKTILSTEDGMEVVGENGDSCGCLKDAAKYQPDVLLLDINMPGTNGIDALPRLQEAMPDTSIVVLTSAHPTEHEREALDRGAIGFIQKPYNVFELPGMIRDTLADAGIDAA
jgi:two-component system response regulator DegU